MLKKAVSMRQLLNTHNICFDWEIKKLIFWYTLLTKGLNREEKGQAPFIMLNSTEHEISIAYKIENDGIKKIF